MKLYSILAVSICVMMIANSSYAELNPNTLNFSLGLEDGKRTKFSTRIELSEDLDNTPTRLYVNGEIAKHIRKIEHTFLINAAVEYDDKLFPIRDLNVVSSPTSLRVEHDAQGWYVRLPDPSTDLEKNPFESTSIKAALTKLASEDPEHYTNALKCVNTGGTNCITLDNDKSMLNVTLDDEKTIEVIIDHLNGC